MPHNLVPFADVARRTVTPSPRCGDRIPRAGAKQYRIDRDPSRDPASSAVVPAHIPNRMLRGLLAPSLSPACLPIDPTLFNTTVSLPDRAVASRGAPAATSDDGAYWR